MKAATQAYKKSAILVMSTREFHSTNPHACVFYLLTKYTYNFIYVVYHLCTVKLSSIVWKPLKKKKKELLWKHHRGVKFVHHNLPVHIYYFFNKLP
jgi:hypothetical protein